MNAQMFHTDDSDQNAETARLRAAREAGVAWRKWGPYLSERQWGTVREDYSENGDAWAYFSHDQARSRAYRWGEDGLVGISDDKQLLCFALALWNGEDPIVKERLFGLTNSEGNHGEDVKEYYFYLDSTPTHSYVKYLYKYPQSAYPYDDLVATNRQRTRQEPEYELIDTGVFDDNRYFDVFVEYAKENPEDILVQISAANRGPEAATLHLLPTLWFRNTWSWDAVAPDGTKAEEGLRVDVGPRPLLRSAGGKDSPVIHAHHEAAEEEEALGDYYVYCQGGADLLFTENETNSERIFGTPNSRPYVKDAFNDYLVHGEQDAVNPDRTGTKAAAHYVLTVPGGETATVRLRLCKRPPQDVVEPLGDKFNEVLQARRSEADEFYAALTPRGASDDVARVMRQALSGMLMSKQYYALDVDRWLEEHGIEQFGSNGKSMRNREWYHMVNHHIISMPDKWEYPWYAAWDLAFHAIALSAVDVDFAKSQLDLMLQDFYMHPSGQIPAYEWNFSDVNPPVHAWATIFLHRTMEALRGQGDLEFLKRSFGKLMLNFSWWVNRKDRFGKNVFEGGFLGLDNIGVFDRSAPLPTGGHLEQADGTAWVSLFCQNMLEMGMELAPSDPTYEDLSIKFADHFLWIAHAMNREGREGMWDEEDGFYYDVLRLPDGSAQRLKVRSMVGLLPLCATTVIEPWQRERVPRLLEHVAMRVRRMPELRESIHPTGPGHLGYADRGIVALVNRDRLQRIMSRLLDENEFLGPYGIRALSRYHADHPYIFNVDGQEFRVGYLPAESDTGMFGGNSNWRGPIWIPVNVLLLRAMLQFYLYYGNDFKVECPTGSGKWMNFFEVAREIAQRLARIFLRDASGRRAVYGGTEKFQSDPYWRDNLLFYEYFHGDNGAGLGASHQTGWTGLVGQLIHLFGNLDAEAYLEGGKGGVFQKVESVR